MDQSIDKNAVALSNNITGAIDNLGAGSVSKAKEFVSQSYKHIRGENIFRKTLILMGLIMVILVLGIFLTLIVHSMPSISAIGPKYLWSKTWNPVHDIYGALPFLLGTLLTSFLALIISIPFSISIAILLGEYYPKGWLPDLLKNTVELIAAVPSVIYGFWGLAVLVPLVRTVLSNYFHVNTNGFGVFTSSIILAIMIIPYAASLGRSMIQMVPSALKEGAYALGATRWEVIRNVIIPYTKSGLLAGILLSLGRALGETMAVTMVIGNTNIIPKIFSTGNTMASVIANEFTEADKPVYLSALIELGLVLFVVTIIINLIGKKLISKIVN